MRSLKGIKKRRYKAEEKAAAARRVLAGESVTALSEELGINSRQFYRWAEVYRKEGAVALGRKQGRPGPGYAPPSERDAREQRIVELERLLGRQAAELDFFEQAFRVLNLATPGNDAPGASGSTLSSSGSAPKARSASKPSASSAE
jgi:transposase